MRAGRAWIDGAGRAGRPLAIACEIGDLSPHGDHNPPPVAGFAAAASPFDDSLSHGESNSSITADLAPLTARVREAP
jgi:hypothetical protein